MRTGRLPLVLLAIAASLWASACGHKKAAVRPPAVPPTTVIGTCRPPDLVRVARNRLATFRIDILPRGHGSGILVSTEGHILTAHHVVEDAAGLRITMLETDGSVKTYPAKVVAVDEKHDLAVIKIERRFRQPAIVAGIGQIEPGDSVYSVGYPHDFGEMVSRGNIMRLDWSESFKSGSVDQAMLADIKDGAGTSGSGVFAAKDGKLIGILVMKVWVGRRLTPATVVHVVVPIKFMRPLLQKAKVPFRSEFARPKMPNKAM